jgi:hypothetical protein
MDNLLNSAASLSIHIKKNIAWFAEELGLTLDTILETRRSGGRQDTCLSMVES